MRHPFVGADSEPDLRLAGSAPAKWGRIQAVSKRFRGIGTGHFSMWGNSTASGLKVWVEAQDGFQQTDLYDPWEGDSGQETDGPRPGLPRMQVMEDGKVVVITRQRSSATNPQIAYHWETAPDLPAVEWQAVEVHARDAAGEDWETVV